MQPSRFISHPLIVHSKLTCSVPSDVPDVVEPNMSKVDFPRLSQDAPKYYKSGVFHDDAKNWWESFILNFEDTYGTTPSTNPPWPLDILKTAGVVAASVAEPVVSDKISSIHKSQMENSPDVSCYHYKCT
jgi:hypothetical protein